MLDPKIFYRKLDTILSKISHTETRKDNLSYIVNELVDIFGKDLHFGSHRIYQESDNEYQKTFRSGIGLLLYTWRNQVSL